LTIAAGENGGFYVEFGELLVRELRERGIDARIAETGGSVENVGHVVDGSAALGLVLNDIAQAARNGEPPFREPLDLRAVGRVYENYMQLVVRAEDPIDEVADLSGRSVSMGAPGSGAAVFADRLLDVAGVVAAVTRRSLREAAAALESGASAGLLWSGGVPTPALAELALRRPIRLVPLAQHLPALRERHGTVYGPATVRRGVYGASRTVATVGVANLLVATPTFPHALADSVVRALVTSTSELVPPSALGAQYLDQHSLIGTGGVPLHDGAVAAYRDLHG
jgi:TRAP transporter TAXI family solute receptor